MDERLGQPAASSASARASTISATDGPIWPPRGRALVDLAATEWGRAGANHRRLASRLRIGRLVGRRARRTRPTRTRDRGADDGSTYSVTSTCRSLPSASTGVSLGPCSARESGWEPVSAVRGRPCPPSHARPWDRKRARRDRARDPARALPIHVDVQPAVQRAATAPSIQPPRRAMVAASLTTGPPRTAAC